MKLIPWVNTYLGAAALACMAGLAPNIAAAQNTIQGTAPNTATFELELNSAAETEAGSCRLTYVATNRSDLTFDRTAFQVGIFDADGAVTRLLVLEFGALVAGKTKILQFDLASQSCTSISRIVVNDTAACILSDDGGESDFCASGLVASSRTAIQFGI